MMADTQFRRDQKASVPHISAQWALMLLEFSLWVSGKAATSYSCPGGIQHFCLVRLEGTGCSDGTEKTATAAKDA